MGPRAALDRGVSTGLHLGRGTADLVVRVAGPPLGRIVRSVLSRARRDGSPAAPATFTPSAREVRPTVDPGGRSGASTDVPPSPAAVARNIGPPRASAKAPRKRSAPKSAPGAKLPPPRPSAS
jgi:hypothetical protein